MKRFWDKVEKTPTCWIWIAGTDGHGYGQFDVGGRLEKKRYGAHRFAYELLVGPIPEGLQLDHLCRNPLCVNPAHLEPVTGKENRRRGLQGVLKTHCAQGHPWISENWYILSGSGKKMCRPCSMERCRRRYAKVKAERELGKVKVKRMVDAIGVIRDVGGEVVRAS